MAIDYFPRHYSNRFNQVASGLNNSHEKSVDLSAKDEAYWRKTRIYREDILLASVNLPNARSDAINRPGPQTPKYSGRLAQKILIRS